MEEYADGDEEDPNAAVLAGLALAAAAAAVSTPCAAAGDA